MNLLLLFKERQDSRGERQPARVTDVCCWHRREEGSVWVPMAESEGALWCLCRRHISHVLAGNWCEWLFPWALGKGNWPTSMETGSQHISPASCLLHLDLAHRLLLEAPLTGLTFTAFCWSLLKLPHFFHQLGVCFEDSVYLHFLNVCCTCSLCLTLSLCKYLLNHYFILKEHVVGFCSLTWKLAWQLMIGVGRLAGRLMTKTVEFGARVLA